MPAHQLSMRHITLILELHHELKLSNRAIARQVGISRSSVARTLERAKARNVSWPLLEDLTEADLRRKLYPNAVARPARQRKEPDWAQVHQKLRKHRTLTLMLLWREYNKAHPQGYQRSQYFKLYRDWRARRVDVVMRQEHKAGEKLFIDYSGFKPTLVDPKTGAVTELELFVAALGASNYTYAEVTPGQTTADLCGSLRRTFEFLGGLPRAVVSDNLKAAVIRFNPDDVPQLNKSYEDLLDHYRVGALPARPYRPRDKATVEKAVQHVQRSVMAPLRNVMFASVQELNEAIAKQLTAINRAPFQKLDGSRHSWFEAIDKPQLRPLPPTAYYYGEWTGKRKVGFNYHIQVNKHFYSVPYRYAGKQVYALVRENTVEIMLDDQRIAAHRRGRVRGGYTTTREHMPSHHRKHADWSDTRFLSWARRIGPKTHALIQANFFEFEIPEQCFRRCMGILKLADKFGAAALEQAAAHAMALQQLSSRAVTAYIKRITDTDRYAVNEIIEHENIRGADYYGPSTKNNNT